MHRPNIVIAESDRALADQLFSSLDRQFRSVKLVQSLGELRLAIPGHQVDAVVADLETVDLQQLADLKSVHKLTVICTHRVPDEAMWTAALEADVFDVCQSNDIPAIVDAIQRSLQVAKATAA